MAGNPSGGFIGGMARNIAELKRTDPHNTVFSGDPNWKPAPGAAPARTMAATPPPATATGTPITTTGGQMTGGGTTQLGRPFVQDQRLRAVSLLGSVGR